MDPPNGPKLCADSRWGRRGRPRSTTPESAAGRDPPTTPSTAKRRITRPATALPNGRREHYPLFVVGGVVGCQCPTRPASPPRRALVGGEGRRVCDPGRPAPGIGGPHDLHRRLGVVGGWGGRSSVRSKSPTAQNQRPARPASPSRRGWWVGRGAECAIQVAPRPESAARTTCIAASTRSGRIPSGYSAAFTAFGGFPATALPKGRREHHLRAPRGCGSGLHKPGWYVFAAEVA